MEQAPITGEIKIFADGGAEIRGGQSVAITHPTAATLSSAAATAAAAEGEPHLGRRRPIIVVAWVCPSEPMTSFVPE
jgi:hypothetical protein